MGGQGGTIAAVLASFLGSALLTMLTIRYATRRQMLDLPGQRRSHSVPTPRGGGFAIVVSVLCFAILPLAFSSSAGLSTMPLLVGVALSIVAGVGWIDDHGGLRARYRLAAHCVAAALLTLPWQAATSAILSSMGTPASLLALASWITLIIAAVAIVWSINLHNFMDGINGLLASQASFVFISLGVFGMTEGVAGRWIAAFVAAAAVLGFMPFNFPRARIFMGDVGSGALGLLVAVAVIHQMGDAGLGLIIGLIACSAFVTDATVTLLSRMLRGRRWYDAHREHLYQSLVRSGRSHAAVVGLYLVWNLLVALPAMLLVQSQRSAMVIEHTAIGLPATSIVVLSAVYALAVVVWCTGKRHCLHRLKHGVARGPA